MKYNHLTVLVCFVACCSLKAIAVPTYDIINLGVLPGNQISSAMGINQRGEVTGVSSTPSIPFLSTPTGQLSARTVPHGFLGGSAFAINDRGELAGMLSAGTTESERAACWYGQHIVHIIAMLDGVVNSAAMGINNDRQMVGYSRMPNNSFRAWKWDGVAFTYEIEGLPNFASTYARAINHDGIVAGYSSNSGVNSQAFVWFDGLICALPNPSGWSMGMGWGINSFCQVAGYGRRDLNHPILPIVWNWDEVYVLPALGAYANAFALNDHGVVVGQGEVGNDLGSRAIVWHDCVPFNLNHLVRNGQGWVLESARGVNNRGEIVGWGTFQGLRRAFKLVPTNRPPIFIDPSQIEQVEVTHTTIRVQRG